MFAMFKYGVIGGVVLVIGLIVAVPTLLGPILFKSALKVWANSELSDMVFAHLALEYQSDFSSVVVRTQTDVWKHPMKIKDKVGFEIKSMDIELAYQNNRIGSFEITHGTTQHKLGQPALNHSGVLENVNASSLNLTLMKLFDKNFVVLNLTANVTAKALWIVSGSAQVKKIMDCAAVADTPYKAVNGGYSVDLNCTAVWPGQKVGIPVAVAWVTGAINAAKSAESVTALEVQSSQRDTSAVRKRTNRNMVQMATDAKGQISW